VAYGSPMWDLFLGLERVCSHLISCFDLGPVSLSQANGVLLGKGAGMGAMVPLRSGFLFGQERGVL
jgi:hypothetical protein